MKIDEVKLNIISDSRGKDTLEATLISGDLEATASVPSGKSTGATEVANIDPHQALEKVEFIKSKFKDFNSLEEFDNTFRGIGGNLSLALSMAFCRLLAKKENLELFEYISKISGNQKTLPLCFFNLINGGLHATNSLPFQEYLFIPQTNSPKDSLESVTTVISKLKEQLGERYGDEGGFTVPSDDPSLGLKILSEFGERLGLDIATSAMKNKFSIDEVILISNKYNLFSIEDPCDEEDWISFAKITHQIGDKIWIVGDDLLTTNVERIKKAHELKAVNAVLIKPNQIGTITETIQAVNLAKSYGWKIIVSHRSGETMDTFIADLAVGVGADGLKSGCPLQKERLVKYERLEEIEKCLI